jgi:transglutaminase-like putative cysteine protease
MHLVFCLLAVGAGLQTYCQEGDFGEITKKQLMDTSYPADSAASAAVLYRSVNVKFDYRPSSGFHVITLVHERVKIYDKQGYRYATVSENLYKSQTESESLSGLKGVTYNLEGGKIVKSKVKGGDTFSKSLNKYYNQETFTMPNVKEGSIVEYQYRLDSPFTYSIDEIDLQYDIPIQKQEISVAIPEYYFFKPIMKGYLQISPTYSNSTDRITQVVRTGISDNLQNDGRYGQQSMDYRVTTTRFSMKHVPALVEEPYVNDIDNYRSSINYELQYVQFPQSERKDYSGSWEQVVNTIYKNDGFGRQLTSSRYFNKLLEGLLAGIDTPEAQLSAIFSHVRSYMNWKGYKGYITDKGIKRAYEDQSGNIAEINLLLVGLLKAAGFEARPVLLSTRDNGIPIFPTLEGFNYVIASVNMEGTEVFLDATSKFAVPGLLPARALNWHGTIVDEDGTSQPVAIMPTIPSREINMMSIRIDGEGRIEGRARRTYTDYNAYVFRNARAGTGESEYLEQEENKYLGMEILDYGIDNLENAAKPVVENFNLILDGQLQLAGDKLLFRPLLHQALLTNPFKLDKREYPIDFTFPKNVKHLYTITLPEGYQIDYLPEGIRLALDNNMGSFNYQIDDLGNGRLQLLSELSLNQAIIPAMNYPMIKEFYRQVVEKQTEKVVLLKTSSDEYTESAIGGR